MIVNVDGYCDVRYGLRGREPTKAQRNTVSQMCRDGVLDAFKSGRRWFIRLEERDADDGKRGPA